MTDGMLDQSLALASSARAALSYIDDLVERAEQMGTDQPLIDYVNGLRTSVQISGLSLAKMLFMWKQKAYTFAVSDYDFEDHVFSATGISQQTTHKYTDLWESVFVKAPINEDVYMRLMNKPIAGLLLITAAAKEGQLEQDDWEELADATDPATIRKVVRKARGKSTSSETAITIMLDRDGGLTAYQNGSMEPIGWLELNSENEFAKSAVERIVRSAGVMRE